MPRPSSVAFALLVSAFARSACAEEIAGKVLQDHSAAPVASADVRVYKIGVRGFAADLETDAEGHFGASGLAAGDYRIEVAKPNYVGATLPVRINPGASERLTIRLVRCGVVSGRVTDGNGQPVPGAAVQVMTKPAAGLRPLPRTTGRYATVGPDGRYRLYDLPPGQYVIAASYGSHTSAVSRTGIPPSPTALGSGLQLYPANSRPDIFTISGGEEFRNIDFTILTTTVFSVSGKVELPAPKTKFWVTITSVDQLSLAIAVIPATDDGAFRLEGVAPGSYHLFASGPVRGRSFMGAVLADEPLFARMRVEVAQDVSGVSLVPQKSQPASVRLRPNPDAETACPSTASVHLSSLEDWGATLDRTSSAAREKDTAIPNLAPARYQVSAMGLGENCYQTADAFLDLSAKDPGSVIIPLGAAGSVRGRLIGGTAGEFSVVLLSSAPVALGAAMRVATPDTEGRFTFTALPPGKYRIAAQRTSESSNARWVADLARMAEIEVRGGAAAEVELAVPPPPNPSQ